MILDARTLEDGRRLEADLVVIGGGAAGIAIARAFAGSRHRVVLVESGGPDFDPDIQDLYQGRITGLPYLALDVCRLRQLGGSTAHWAGRSRPFDPFDFEPRPWIPYSGWPIGPDALLPHLDEAHALLGLGPARYDPAFWEFGEETLLPVDVAQLRNLVWQFSPLDLGLAYRDELERAANLDLLLWASLVDIQTDPEARRVESLVLATLGGPRLEVRAPLVVLACGGLENARLLLASRSVRPQGLGNDHDLVGRFFMEHPHLPAARVLITDPSRDLAPHAGIERQGVRVMSHLALAPELQKEAEILHWQGQLSPDHIGDSGFAALRRLLRAARGLRWPDDLGGDLATVVRDWDDTLAGVLARAGLRDHRPEQGAYILWSHCEQAPDPDSRVTLDEEVDALGMPRLRLDWRLGELERRTLQVVHDRLARELGRTGTGRLQEGAWLAGGASGWPDEMIGGNHHMGTTRMSADPRQGVVDALCRVHGIDNLYVAGSSVFTTGGCVNPTLNLVTLALRLAAHLRARLEA